MHPDVGNDENMCFVVDECSDIKAQFLKVHNGIWCYIAHYHSNVIASKHRECNVYTPPQWSY
jgi:hypothetical protein